MPAQIERNREYYRFVTSGFLHANFTHLLWNMFSFFFFGPVVEASGIVGGITVWLQTRSENHQETAPSERAQLMLIVRE